MFLPAITLTSPSKAGLSTSQEITKQPPFFVNGGSRESFLLKFNSDDEEIDVFDARKYFNEGLEFNPTCNNTKNSSPANLHKKDDQPFKPQSPSKTTLLTMSESSSNSQSALLNIAARNRRPRRGFLANYCPCATWTACHADESVKSAKTGNQGMKLAEGNGGDSDSDGSSDLFEIDSLQSKSWLPSDGVCYPPSEASIEWSVVTASATDYFAVSDSECGVAKSGRSNMKGGSLREISKVRPGGILSGCTGQIAVSVAHTAKGKAGSGSEGRLRPAAEGLTGVGGKIRSQSFDGGAPSRSGKNAKLV